MKSTWKLQQVYCKDSIQTQSNVTHGYNQLLFAAHFIEAECSRQLVLLQQNACTLSSSVAIDRYTFNVN